MKSVFDDIKQASETRGQTVTVIGFGRRFVAMFVDGITLMFVSFILAFLIGMIDVFLGRGVLPWPPIIVIFMILFSVYYFSGKWVQNSGQTLGKLMLNIKIVSKDGTQLTFRKLFLRYLGYIINGLAASLGFIWISIDKERRGWHDMIAKTYVIHLRDDMPEDGNVTLIPSDSKRGWIWIVLWVLLALAAPAALLGGLWFLGPIMSGLLDTFSR